MLEYKEFSVPGAARCPNQKHRSQTRRYAVKPFGNSQKGSVKRC
jgi:hypothetical protein